MPTEEDVRRIVREELASIEADRSTNLDDLARKVTDAVNHLNQRPGITFKAQSPEEAEAVLAQIRAVI